MLESKSINKKAIVAGTAGVFLLIAAAAFYFFDFRNKRPEGVAVSDPEGIITAPLQDEGVSGSDKKPDDIMLAEKLVTPALPSYQGEPIRQLNGDPKFTASAGATFLQKYEKNLKEVADRIDKDSRNYDDWLAVAYIKKLFNNYAGARDAWEYAKVINPENQIAYFNLGELYGYELGDPIMAQKNYESAVRLDPHHLAYHVGFANFYKNVAKNPQKAEEVFLSALDKIPHTEVNLFTEIGAFYRDQQNYQKAIEYFEKAAKVASSPAIEKSVQDEMAYIRSKMGAQ